jgi:membrane-bound lytic murein transglycosylase F
MKQESQFDENAVSYRGARGLMQIMPVTNNEMVEELELRGSSHPRENIQAGIYYFSKLYRQFKAGTYGDRIRLALAAYNAGPSRIYDAQELASYLGENPSDWRSIRHVLPLLSKRYYSLHQAVWNDSRPPAGYFGSWRETSQYVDAIVKTYKGYLSGQ